MTEGILAALVGALAVLAGGLLQHFSTSRQWGAQQRWSARERYYTKMLTHLGRLRLSLESQHEHFATSPPGVEHLPLPAHFDRLQKEAGKAIRELRRMVGPARLYLSAEATRALEEMDHATYSVAVDAIHTGEYVEKALPFVEKAEKEVLSVARDELGVQMLRSRLGEWLMRAGVILGVVSGFAKVVTTSDELRDVDWPATGLGYAVATLAVGTILFVSSKKRL
jgi:hypothetical protein